MASGTTARSPSLGRLLHGANALMLLCILVLAGALAAQAWSRYSDSRNAERVVDSFRMSTRTFSPLASEIVLAARLLDPLLDPALDARTRAQVLQMRTATNAGFEELREWSPQSGTRLQHDLEWAVDLARRRLLRARMLVDLALHEQADRRSAASVQPAFQAYASVFEALEPVRTSPHVVGQGAPSDVLAAFMFGRAIGVQCEAIASVAGLLLPGYLGGLAIEPDQLHQVFLWAGQLRHAGQSMDRVRNALALLGLTSWAGLNAELRVARNDFEQLRGPARWLEQQPGSRPVDSATALLGQALASDLLSDLASLESLLDQVLNAARAHARSESESTLHQMQLVLLLITAALGGIVHTMRTVVRRVLRPMLSLRDDILLLAQDPPPRELGCTAGGSDEIRELGQALEKLRGVRVAQYQRDQHHQAVAANLREQARSDSLTGLMNRRGLESELRAQPPDIPYDGSRHRCLILFDLDHFKRVNDIYGHPVGDAVLREVAQRVRGCSRASDVVARIGGEEFAVLMSGMERGDLERFGEKLRNAICEEPIRIDAARSLRITASFGAVTAAADVDWGTLVAKADAALYESKRLGRDRVTVVDLAQTQALDSAAAPTPASVSEPGKSATQS